MLTVATGCATSPVGSTQNKSECKPNFIIFLTDDQGYSDVGCFGSPDIRTANFDRLAAEGIRLTSHYVGEPVCGPSRAALMTGSYPIRIAEPKNTKRLHTVLHNQDIAIPELLKEQGYASALIGKWHLGGSPNNQGFDYFFGTPFITGPQG